MQIESKTLAALLVIAAAGCVSTTGGQATTGAATPANAVAAADGQPADASKVRCKRMAVTGSRHGKKVCGTEEQWAQMDRAADDLMRDIQAEPMPYIDGQSGTGFRGADGMGSVPR